MKAAGQERRKAFFNSPVPRFFYASTYVKPGHRGPGKKLSARYAATLSRSLLRNTIASGSSTLSSPRSDPIPDCRLAQPELRDTRTAR